MKELVREIQTFQATHKMKLLAPIALIFILSNCLEIK
jgi:hypothetical protein